MRPNPQDTNAFALVNLICQRFRDADPDHAVAAVATSDGGVATLSYRHLRELLVSALESGVRLQRISAWHSRDTAPGGVVGDECIECGMPWPCGTRRMADGTHEDLDDDE